MIKRTEAAIQHSPAQQVYDTLRSDGDAISCEELVFTPPGAMSRLRSALGADEFGDKGRSDKSDCFDI